MVINYICITDNSIKLANKIKSLLDRELIERKINIQSNIILYSDFKNNKKEIFDNSEYLIFIMAIGIAVRSIAPLMKDKFSDPGVIVLDEYGKNVISLLSGHMGGANEMTEKIAELIKSNPVITTATDVNNVGAFDLLVKKVNGYVEDFRDLSLKINSQLIKDIPVYIYIQDDYFQYFINTENEVERCLRGFKILHSFEDFEGRIKKFDDKNNIDIIKNDSKERTYIVVVTDSKKIYDKIKKYNYDNDKYEIVMVIPKMNVIGIGCRKNTNVQKFEQNILNNINENDILIKSICTIGSIDLKKDEKCILDFADKYHLNTEFFDSEIIKSVQEKYEKSDFVMKQVGVYSVAEPVCHLLCNGNIISKKFKKEGMTISIGRKK